MTPILQSSLYIPQILPFSEWLTRVRACPQIDVSDPLEYSECLRGLKPVEGNTVGKYLHIWKEIGFLEASEEKRGIEKRRRVLWG